MKKIPSIFPIVAACCLLSGCAVMQFVPVSKSTEHRWQNRIAKWLPVGTPVEDVCGIMKQHGFDCDTNYPARASILCNKDTTLTEISVFITIADGKINSVPVTHVMRAGSL